jgi:small ligand-binding sensory domain FIST
MKWASAVSERADLEEAMEEAAAEIRTELGGSQPDLAAVFVSPHHAQGYERVSSLVAKALGPRVLLGCSGGGVIGGGQEVEFRPGLSLTAAALPAVELLPFHVEEGTLPDPDAPPEAWEGLVGTTPASQPQFLLLADPFTFPAERLVQGLDYAFTASIKIGGLASGAQRPGGNALFLGDQVHGSGAIGVALQGNIAVEAIVAQGCRPVGPVMRITRCAHNMLAELDDRPAVEALRTLFHTMSEEDQTLASHSLFLGIAMDTLQDEPDLGDFLVRNLMGMDPRTGALAIGEMLQEGQQVRFHLRDATTSGEELDGLLARYAGDRTGAPDWGSLLFSCLGRGEGLYGVPNHDSDLFRRYVGRIPLGGFFCNGEIGPVGGTTFLHGYTSSFGIFRPRQR